MINDEIFFKNKVTCDDLIKRINKYNLFYNNINNISNSYYDADYGMEAIKKEILRFEKDKEQL